MMPRFSSIVDSLQLWPPPIQERPSFGRVSEPNSPGAGIVWNTHFSSPVFTS